MLPNKVPNNLTMDTLPKGKFSEHVVDLAMS